MFAAIFLRCYLCLSPVLLRLAYASKPSFFVRTKECVTNTSKHIRTRTRIHTHYISTCYAFAHITHAHTKMMLAEIVHETKEVSKCVFERTLYLRSVHLLWTHEIVVVGWEMTMKISAPYCLQLFSNSKKIGDKQWETIVEQIFKMKDGTVLMPLNRCKSNFYSKFMKLPW